LRHENFRQIAHDVYDGLPRLLDVVERLHRDEHLLDEFAGRRAHPVGTVPEDDPELRGGGCVDQRPLDAFLFLRDDPEQCVARLEKRRHVRVRPRALRGLDLVHVLSPPK